MKTCAALLAAVSMIMVLAAPVRADEPKPVIAKAVEQILGFLRDPALQSARDAQAVKIKSVARTIFDYRVISMRTLGRHWKSFSPAQQEEFVTLYSDLLENTYVKRLQAYQNEQVVVGEEVKLEEGKTEVRTSVLAAAGPVPISYRMYQKDGAWKVYDVLAEGISLTNNYRTQFNDIMSKGGPEDVLNSLRGRK